MKLKNYSRIIYLGFLFLLITESLMAQDSVSQKAKTFLGEYDHVIDILITDEVSVEKNNTKLKIYFKKKKLLGFSRGIETTTGCSSECLPFAYTSYYDAKGQYIDLYSKEGLTKKYHIPFTEEDYAKLNLILVMSPSIFSTIAHPKEMTDAISGATLKNYQEAVVESAAYTTLRVHLYHQETLKHIKAYLAKNQKK